YDITIVDMLGQVRFVVGKGLLIGKGSLGFHVDTHQLPAGMYSVVVAGEKEVVSESLVLVK
ncbi:MAG: hypothetical protein J5I53_03725, partial [Bradyrhizobiaceae bacterium]|nr:hypothetical protein [Bradyrhizobiaceae bacterium]